MKWTVARRNHLFYELASAAGPGIPVWPEIRTIIGWYTGSWPSLYLRSKRDIGAILAELPWIDLDARSEREYCDPEVALVAASLWQVHVDDRLILSVRTQPSAWPVYTAAVTLARTGFARRFATYRDRMWEEKGLPGFLRRTHDNPAESRRVAESAVAHLAAVRSRLAAAQRELPVIEAAVAKWAEAAAASDAAARLRGGDH